MRIISGKNKGKKLFIPNNSIARPTTDRLKETLFNVLRHRYNINFDDTIVLDCFAGSGALGIECISRGCKEVWFLDNNKHSIDIVKKNVNLINAESLSRVIKEDASKIYFNNVINKFNLVFLDPPYDSDLINITVTNLLKQDIICNDCYFVIESNIPNYTFVSLNVIDILKAGKNMHYICKIILNKNL